MTQDSQRWSRAVRGPDGLLRIQWGETGARYDRGYEESIEYVHGTLELQPDGSMQVSIQDSFYDGSLSAETVTNLAQELAPMEATNIVLATRQAKQIAQTLRADDPRFRRSCTLLHRDGSTLHYRHAFLIWIGPYLACFTEHHRFHVYHPEDLYRFDQHDGVPIERHEESSDP